MSGKDKRHKEKISYTIIGIVIYSVILLLVVAGVYMGVRTILNRGAVQEAVEPSVNNEEIKKGENEAQAQVTELPSEQKTEEESDSNNSEVVEDEDRYIKHDIDITKIIDPKTNLVDSSARLFKPSGRKETKWKDTVFSKIENVKNPKEAIVNTYKLKRVSVTLSDQKDAVYSAYINPESEYIEKITEVINCGEEFEVTDYYYDCGDINYIADYKQTILKPIPISSADIESRYYYANDEMVRFIYCSDGKATEYTASDIDSYSKGTVEQFDFLESEMINRAYMALNLAKSLDEKQTIYGYVLDEFSVPLGSADVEIVSDNTGIVVAKTTTDGDGHYELTIDNDDNDTYTIKVNKETLDGVNVYGITAANGSLRYAVDPVYMRYSGNGAVYNAQIMVRDAMDSTKNLASADIKIRRGLNNRSGDAIASGTLSDTGAATVPMSAGCYTAEVSKKGYETSYFPVVIRADHPSVLGYAVPEVGEDAIAVVLSWETTSLDLDIKAISSNHGRVIQHVADSQTATMAETVMIDSVGTDDYAVYISDYASILAGDAMSYNMSGSNAYVSVYNSDGYMQGVHVPVASAGICWEPFEIRDGKVIYDSNYYYVFENNSLWTQK